MHNAYGYYDMAMIFGFLLRDLCYVNYHIYTIHNSNARLCLLLNWIDASDYFTERVIGWTRTCR